MKSTKGVTGLLLLGSLLLGSLSACGKDGEKPAAKPAEPKTIKVAQLADMVGWNELITPATPIHTGLLYFGVFLQLLEEQANYQSGPATMKPRLAESWEFSPDRLQLTFKLRPGVVWSDGQPITADDVVFTFEAQRTPEIEWQMAESKSRITKVEALDPLTVRYHFKEAYSTQLLDANEGVILPKHAWSKIPFKEWKANAAFFDQNLVTSGPFRLESWQPQQRVVLVRNEKYFEPGIPKVDRVVIEVVPDEPNQVALLRAGTVDAIENVPAQNVAELAKDPDIDLPKHIPRTYFDIIWNTTRPLLAEKEVRQAITLAIDRQAIVDTLLFGYANIGASPYPSSFWVRKQDLKPWPYDPQRSRELLAKAGFADQDGDGILERNGQKFEIELLAPTENLLRRNVALLAQENLKKVGIAATPRVMEFNSMMAPVQKQQFDGLVSGLAIATNLSVYQTFHTKGTFNWGLYSNPELDRLIEKIDAAVDPRTVKADFDRVQEILHEDQPVTFTYESQRISGNRKRVKNLEPNALSFFFNMRNWEVTD
jgi:peptide/nickel transport system substrate-binding protein